MSRREEILRNAEKMRRQEKVDSKRRKKERPYDGSGMDMERMPLGCWMVIAAIVAIVFLIAKSVLH